MKTSHASVLSPAATAAKGVDQAVIHVRTRRETHLIVCCVPESNRERSSATFAIMEGARVVTNQGEPIGSIERVVAKRDKNGPEDYLIAKALVLKEKLLIPVEWIDSLGEDEVRLADGWNSSAGQTARNRDRK